MFSGCEESAGDLISNESGKYKTYRGSASQESYVVQNKEAPWRTPEGTAILVPYKGPVLRILNNISGGLRSACSYVGAFTLAELKASGRFAYLK
jgi:GMP reductase